jgi:hypothetical protein
MSVCDVRASVKAARKRRGGACCYGSLMQVGSCMCWGVMASKRYFGWLTAMYRNEYCCTMQSA